MRLTPVRQIGDCRLIGPPTVGLRRFGVPPGGPFDTESSRLANALVGNPPWAPVIELALFGAELRVESGGWIAAVGGGHEVTNKDGELPIDRRWQVHPGQELSFRPSTMGLRLYLGTPGGWVRPFEATGANFAEGVALAEAPWSLDSASLRYVPDDIPGGRHTATVGAQLDRVGVRLTPTEPVSRPGASQSVPSIFGRIQATPAGEFLIHGPDGPTIGGYGTIGTVIGADLDKVGQLRPGQSVSFEPVGLEEARAMTADQGARIERLEGLIRLRALGPR
ncbi:MAG: hypothetical protein JSS66_11845 [Armatimonadetes bacterium]|nr:hypothetical protein [Armatimonadota bacterium]